ncbi:hypothetical protein DITRI_Ditri04bG0180600 [Diplodiscus trichospermus]
MGEDVFWAIKGGDGGSFGIVLDWKIKLVSVPATVTVFTVTKTLEQNATKLVRHWQYVAPKLSNDIFILLSISRASFGQDEGNKTIQASFSALFLGRVDKLISLMEKRFPKPRLLKENCTEMSWIKANLYFAQFQCNAWRFCLIGLWVANPFSK